MAGAKSWTSCVRSSARRPLPPKIYPNLKLDTRPDTQPNDETKAIRNEYSAESHREQDRSAGGSE
jgi:hypothetical protein